MIKKTRKQFGEFSPLDTTELLKPQISLSSNKEMLVEGCAGIIEYTPELVRINCKALILNIRGDSLTIKADTTEEISVSGKIISLDFTGI